ncbi:putative TIM-barrel fold metal-dependent hydrolase [Streptomyces calvus]
MYDLVVLPHRLPACARAAAALPGPAFVLDHAGKPPVASGAVEPWASDVRALADLPHTVCKLSGPVTEAAPGSWSHGDLRPYADVVLDAFGPGRTMFGSDWPVCTLEAAYGDVLATARALTGHLDDAGRREVFETTAVRVYDL